MVFGMGSQGKMQRWNAGGRRGRRWMALRLVLLGLLVALWTWLQVQGAIGPQPQGEYLVAGAPAWERAPVRGCSPEALAALDVRVEIPPPEGGWPGVPQAVDVFNVFAGEVMVAHGEREVCGRMHDAGTRDSRFRAGVGMVVVPPAGDMEPIRVAWTRPLKPAWIPTVRVGAPSPVQQIDTARLLVRAAALAVAIALAFTALMGFLSARDGVFLGYALLCLLAVLWQAILSGLSGYPQPWLPVGESEWRWLTAFSCIGLSTLLYGMWLLVGGAALWLSSRRHLLQLTLACWIGGAVLAATLPMAALAPLARGVDLAFRLGYLMVFAIGLYGASHRRAFAAAGGSPEGTAGLAAMLPFLAMGLLDLAGNRWLVEYRVEAIQGSITWFLTVSAYALNLRLGRLRRQRDEMQQLADTDALTSLPNRRAGLRTLDQRLQQARAGDGALTVGFLDIDLFKRINDLHGHAVGDRVLVAVARVLAAAVGEPAHVIRMGGEEFLLLLPGVEGEAARRRMGFLRRRVSEAAAGLGVPGLAVTASIGLASLRAGDRDAAALLRRADEAMYRAKRGGRDRVEAAGEEPEPSAV